MNKPSRQAIKPCEYPPRECPCKKKKGQTCRLCGKVFLVRRGIYITTSYASTFNTREGPVFLPVPVEDSQYRDSALCSAASCNPPTSHHKTAASRVVLSAQRRQHTQHQPTHFHVNIISFAFYFFHPQYLPYSTFPDRHRNTGAATNETRCSFSADAA